MNLLGNDAGRGREDSFRERDDSSRGINAYPTLINLFIEDSICILDFYMNGSIFVITVIIFVFITNRRIMRVSNHLIIVVLSSRE